MQATERSADCTVLYSSIAMVMGPTPPGTGVIAEAFSPHALELHIPDDAAIGQAVDAHVDHHGAGAHHLRDDQARNTRRHHQNIGEHGEHAQIAGFLVADAHRRFLLHQHQRHGLADDVAGADDDDIAALDRDVLVLEDLLYAIRRAGRKHRVAGDQATDVVEVEAVDILVKVDALQHAVHVDLWWQRQLHQDAVDGRIGIERIDTAHQLILGGRHRQFDQLRTDTHELAGGHFVADVDLGGRIIADQDDGQARPHPVLLLQAQDALLLFCLGFSRQSPCRL